MRILSNSYVPEIVALGYACIRSGFHFYMDGHPYILRNALIATTAYGVFAAASRCIQSPPSVSNYNFTRIYPYYNDAVDSPV